MPATANPSNPDGDWEVCNGDQVWKSSDEMVAQAFGPTPEIAEQRANLFAAAPQLLAALRECMTDIRGSRTCTRGGVAVIGPATIELIESAINATESN